MRSGQEHTACAIVGAVKAVVDTSTLVSLSLSGLLPLLRRAPLPLVILDVVYREAVTDGLHAGHADAAAIEAALSGVELGAATPAATVDLSIAAAAAVHGVVVTNDQTLGRRVASRGGTWWRTADLLVSLVHAGRLDRERFDTGLLALHGAGRISDRQLRRYQEVE